MSKQHSRSESNRQLVDAMNEAVFVDNEFDRLDQFVAPDVVQYQGGELSYEGIDGIEQYFEGMLETYRDTEMDVLELVADDERVMYNFRMHATGADEIEFGEETIDITGEKLSWDGFVSLAIDDGKIVEVTLLTDEAGLLRQIGVLPQHAA